MLSLFTYFEKERERQTEREHKQGRGRERGSERESEAGSLPLSPANLGTNLGTYEKQMLPVAAAEAWWLFVSQQ